MKSAFPDPESADKDGLLCAGGDFSEELLLDAYSNGIFPWPHPGYPILWFSPPKRGILFLDKFKIPKSVKKELTKKDFKLTMNQSFENVMRACSEAKRKKQSGTWIMPEMIPAYLKLHEKGHVLSFECWEQGVLVGGLYGVYLNGVFSGESMFFKSTGASKAALILAITYLKNQGLKWIDIQMVTPVLKLFGGEYISRKEFLNLLKKSQSVINLTSVAETSIKEVLSHVSRAQ